MIVKHANPCGVAVGEDCLAAYERAFSTDPSAAFGGIIAFNRPLDAGTAKAILERQFVEVIVVPAVEPDALSVMAGKPDVRLLACGELASVAHPRSTPDRSTAGSSCRNGISGRSAKGSSRS